MDSAAGCHSIHSHATEDGKVSSSESESSHDEGDSTGEDDNTEEDKGGIETSSDEQVMSDGEEGQECPHTKTLSLALVRSLVNMRTQIQSWTLGRKSSLSGESSTQKTLRRTA